MEYKEKSRRCHWVHFAETGRFRKLPESFANKNQDIDCGLKNSIYELVL